MSSRLSHAHDNLVTKAELFLTTLFQAINFPLTTSPKFKKLIDRLVEMSDDDIKVVTGDGKVICGQKEFIKTVIKGNELENSFEAKIISSEAIHKRSVLVKVKQENNNRDNTKVVIQHRDYKVTFSSCHKVNELKIRITSSETKNLDSCDVNTVKISQSNLPYTIRYPGNYCLIENLIWSGPEPAITILASHVNLNLNGYKIDLNNTTLQGIRIEDAEDVKIYNGSIINVNRKFNEQDAILPLPFSSDYPVPNVTTAAIRFTKTKNIFFSDLVIDNTLYGILGTQVISGVSVKRVTITNYGNSGVIGTQLVPIGTGIMVIGTDNNTRATDFIVEKSKTISDTAKDGISCMYTNRFNWQDCYSATGSSLEYNPSNLGAYAIYDSAYGNLTNCEGYQGSTIFFSLRAASVDVVNFKALECTADGLQPVFSRSITFRDCVVQRYLAPNSPEPKDGSGIKLMFSDNVVVRNCTIQDFILPDTAPGDGRNGIGISLSACNNCVIENNIANHNTVGIRDQLTVTVGGMLLQGANNVFTDNTATNNILQNYSNVPYVASYNVTPPLISVVPWINVQYPDLPTGLI